MPQLPVPVETSRSVSAVGWAKITGRTKTFPALAWSGPIERRKERRISSALLNPQAAAISEGHTARVAVRHE